MVHLDHNKRGRVEPCPLQCDSCVMPGLNHISSLPDLNLSYPIYIRLRQALMEKEVCKRCPLCRVCLCRSVQSDRIWEASLASRNKFQIAHVSRRVSGSPNTLSHTARLHTLKLRNFGSHTPPSTTILTSAQHCPHHSSSTQTSFSPADKPAANKIVRLFKHSVIDEHTSIRPITSKPNSPKHTAQCS